MHTDPPDIETKYFNFFVDESISQEVLFSYHFAPACRA
nr:MAG TPA: hypothetical protein [Caudoviricetes sp.]